MKKKLVFATGNANKVREIRDLVGDTYEIVSLVDIGCHDDIPETAPTLAGNALQKARYVVEHFQLNCFSEDTGLEIDALNGEPGVYSARYAGLQRDATANMQLVLDKLGDTSERSARFKTVMALSIDGKEHLFEGAVEGKIIFEQRGSGGFGYDPVFQPEGYDQTFGELSPDVKKQISHRARAFKKLIHFLHQ